MPATNPLRTWGCSRQHWHQINRCLYFRKLASTCSRVLSLRHAFSSPLCPPIETQRNTRHVASRLHVRIWHFFNGWGEIQKKSSQTQIFLVWRTRKNLVPHRNHFLLSHHPSHSLITHPSIHHHSTSTMGVMSIRQCYIDERLSVDWSDYRIIAAVACIIFNPTFWNIVARKGISSCCFSLGLENAMDICFGILGRRQGGWEGSIA